MESETEYELLQPPTDGVSAVSFLPQSSNMLLAASWDTVCIDRVLAWERSECVCVCVYVCVRVCVCLNAHM